MADNQVNLSSLPPIPTKNTIAMANYLILKTIDFVNKFYHETESKLLKLEQKMDKLDTLVLLLESKLNSIPPEVLQAAQQSNLPSVKTMDIPQTQSQPQPQQQQQQQPQQQPQQQQVQPQQQQQVQQQQQQVQPQQQQPQQQPQEPQVDPEEERKKAELEALREQYGKFIRMFKVGVHINNVKQAIMNEGLDPSKLEMRDQTEGALNQDFVNEEYKQKILEKYNEKSFTEEMLKDLTNWDRMKLKSDMKCGPEIELIPEKYEKSAEKPASSKIITREQEDWLSSDICVNMDVKRIYYMKSNNDQDVTACFVSLTANAKLFFEILCRKLYSPLHKAEISLLNEEHQFVSIKDYNSKTLEELGIQENSIIRIDFNRDGVPQTSDPIMDSNTTSRQYPENIPYEEFMDDPVRRADDSDDPIPLPNSTTDYSKPPENNLVIAEKKWEIDYEKVTKVNKEVEALTKSNKKFTLEYRSLNSIKTNLKALESDWSAYLKSNLAMYNHHKDGKLS